MKTLIEQRQDISSFNRIRDNFMLSAQAEGKSERTMQLYEDTLSRFDVFAKKEPKAITASDVRAFLNHLNSKGYAKTTVWTHYKELKVFFNFCLSEGYISNNPMALIKKPRIEKLLPRTLTDNEVIALLQAAKRTRGFLGKRNTAIIGLLFDSGLRATELCNLKVADVSLENQIVRVFGKGKKERVIPFSKTTAKLLFSYLKARGNLPFEERFYVTKNGDGFDRKFLCKLIKRIAKKACIDTAKVSPHVFRHSFATSWIRAGGDAKRLQHMIGHADPRVVDVLCI